MTLIIDMTTARNRRDAQEITERLAQRRIRSLDKSQAICRKCGLTCDNSFYSVTEHGHKRNVCANDCRYDNGELMTVFTQDDINEYLPEASETDFDYIEREFPGIAAEMHGRHNGEMAGVCHDQHQ